MNCGLFHVHQVPSQGICRQELSTTSTMITSHTSVAIAQTVFFVPAVPITLYLLVRNWYKGPRMAWYPLFAFSLSRGPVRFSQVESGANASLSTPGWWHYCYTPRLTAQQLRPQYCSCSPAQCWPCSSDNRHSFLSSLRVSC